jgi:hypothetical protein
MMKTGMLLCEILTFGSEVAADLLEDLHKAEVGVGRLVVLVEDAEQGACAGA